MNDSQAKLQKLHKAGIIVADNFSASDLKVIEQITDEEIDVLIKLRHKTGDVPAGKEHMRPNIAV